MHDRKSTNLSLRLHAIPQVDRELPNVSKRVLVRRGVVRAEELARRVLHEVDRGERVRAGGLARAHEGEVGVLEDEVDDGLVGRRGESAY